jgi:beta-lactamase class A
VTLHRRALIAAAPKLAVTGLAAWPMLAKAAAAVSPIPALAAYERDTGGHVGVYAENLATGAKFAWRPDDRFVMCSTFKLSMTALVLTRVDAGHEQLDRMIHYSAADIIDDWYAPVAKANLAKGQLSVAEMCQAAVEDSDNTCANLLLASVGGPAALTAFWRANGDATSRLDHNEPVLNRSPPGDPHDTTTPRAMAGNVRRFVLGKRLSAPSRERLTGWMIDCRTGDNRLRGGLPKAWRIGDKTGNNGKDASGDLAIAWPRPDRPILVCAYVQGGSPTTDQITAVFADIGRLAGERLG